MMSGFKAKPGRLCQDMGEEGRPKVTKGVVCPSEDCQILDEGGGYLIYSRHISSLLQ